MSDQALAIMIAAAWKIAAGTNRYPDAPHFKQLARGILDDMIKVYEEKTTPVPSPAHDLAFAEDPLTDAQRKEKIRCEKIMQLGRPHHHGENNAGF